MIGGINKPLTPPGRIYQEWQWSYGPSSFSIKLLFLANQFIVPLCKIYIGLSCSNHLPRGSNP